MMRRLLLVDLESKYLEIGKYRTSTAGSKYEADAPNLVNYLQSTPNNTNRINKNQQ